ncbi:50S ribosomal protein L19e [Candidatus Woesearchaeota archaeon]|nr:50S ribosomal protein L19e [Candidatus Woesearchaeota archaeon]
MMLQKRLASGIMKCSPKRVKLDTSRLADIKEAITNSDVRQLISEGVIKKIPARGISRARVRENMRQRRKGRHKGPGSRKGKPTSRLPSKKAWMSRIRLQRRFLMEIRAKSLVSGQTFKDLYKKAKGGFFRNKRHIKLYINEQKLFIEKQK